MADEYTPTTQEVRFGFAMSYACDQWRKSTQFGESAFNRWLAAHDAALREQIAREVEGNHVAVDKGRVEPCCAVCCNDSECWAISDCDFASAARIIREGGKK